MSPKTVVFVCTGNTCRSPLAMALARSMFKSEVRFLSAGLQNAGRQPAASHALQVAGELDLILGDHRSNCLDDALYSRADWLIGMTRSHVALMKQRFAGRDGARIGLLGLPNRDLRSSEIPESEEVSDPYGKDLEIYRTAAEQIARLLRSWREAFIDEAKDEA